MEWISDADPLPSIFGTFHKVHTTEDALEKNNDILSIIGDVIVRKRYMTDAIS